MDTYRQNDRMTIMQRGGPAGVTVVITEAPAGRSPHWTISYYPASRYGRGAHAFTDTSDNAPIPEKFSDVLIWAKRRWESHLVEHRAA